MWCALVFYFVATIFVVVFSCPSELCVIINNTEKHVSCRIDDVKYTLAFIPPISQNITYIDMHGQPLKQLPYNAFRNLSSQSSISVIRLRECRISHVDGGAFLNLHDLSIINLSENDIKQIDSKLFSDTKQIKFIYMEYNKIEVLPKGLFQNLILLEEVSLRHNQIHQVEWFSFKNTPSLQLIALSNNKIEFINMLFKDKFDNLTYLLLDGNPWKCNCELGPLYEFLVTINQLNEYAPVCEKPSTLQGRKWSDINRDKIVCRSEDAISIQDSIMTSIEPMITTEQDGNIPKTVYSGTGIPRPLSIQNWILYTIFVLVLVFLAAVIIGVVFIARRRLVESNKRRHIRLPTMVKRRSFWRTNARNMDKGIPMRVGQSSPVSGDNDSASNTDNEQTSIHRYEIREATAN